jgi:hypothetical protein
MPMTDTLHHPSQYEGMTRHADAGAFLQAGGSFHWHGDGAERGQRWIISFSPITYSRTDCRNAVEAMAAAWSLFVEEGGWTIHVWDTEKQEGWSYLNIGPGWIECLERHVAER